MSNTITIELCQEDRNRLDLLNSVLIALGDKLTSYSAPITLHMEDTELKPTEEHTAPQEAQESEAVEESTPEAVVTVTPEPEVVTPVEESKPTVTLDQIRQKVTYLRASSDKAKKDGAKDIVMAYATSISGLANCEDKWPEIWDKLTALEG